MPTKIYKQNSGWFKKGQNLGNQNGFKKGQISLMKGKKHTKETRRKMSESSKGQKAWNKGLKGVIKPNKGSFKKGEHHSLNTQFKKGQKSWNKGLKGFNAGEKSPSWKGGISPINNKIRGSLEYKLWEDSVFNKDWNHCQRCGDNRIYKLVAHHILNFSKYIELRFAIDNGITFCRECHKKFHTKYGKKNNTKEQLEEFLY